MIKSFKDRQTEQLFGGNPVKKLPKELQKQARRRLAYLHVANALSDLLIPPSNRFEALGGNLKNHYSIRVNQQWRLVFRWDNGAVEVELKDYH